MFAYYRWDLWQSSCAHDTLAGWDLYGTALAQSRSSHNGKYELQNLGYLDRDGKYEIQNLDNLYRDGKE